MKQKLKTPKRRVGAKPRKPRYGAVSRIGSIDVLGVAGRRPVSRSAASPTGWAYQVRCRDCGHEWIVGQDRLRKEETVGGAVACARCASDAREGRAARSGGLGPLVSAWLSLVFR